MKHLAHFICFIFGGGSIFFGIIGLLREHWESGVSTLCLGAAMFLLSLVYDKMEEVTRINEKLDLLLAQTRGTTSPGTPPR